MLSAKFILASVAFCLGVLFTGCSKDNSNSNCSGVDCDEINSTLSAAGITGIQFNCKSVDNEDTCVPDGSGIESCTNGDCGTNEKAVNLEGNCYCISNDSAAANIPLCSYDTDCSTGQSCSKATGVTIGICTST